MNFLQFNIFTNFHNHKDIEARKNRKKTEENGNYRKKSEIEIRESSYS